MIEYGWLLYSNGIVATHGWSDQFQSKCTIIPWLVQIMVINGPARGGLRVFSSSLLIKLLSLVFNP